MEERLDHVADDDDWKLKESKITRKNECSMDNEQSELLRVPQTIGEQLLQMLSNVEGIKDGNTLRKLKKDIARFNEYLPRSTTPEIHIESYKTPQIDGYIYGKILQKVVDIFDDNWPFTNNNIDPVIEQLIIVDGSTPLMFHESLTVLTDAVKKFNNDKRIRGLTLLLESLVKSKALQSSVIHACWPGEISAIEREERETLWQSTLQIIVSLPERVANKLGNKTINSFLPDRYTKILATHICETLLFLNTAKCMDRIKPDIKFLSMLMSKAVIVLGALRLGPLFNITSAWCCENPDNIRDTVCRVLNGVERAAVEPIALSYLKISYGRIGIENIFGNLIENRQWKHVLTVKIPLMSYHDNDNLIKNLIVYLSSSNSCVKDKGVLSDLLMRMLDVWGDRSALSHTPFEQHLYITKLILVSAKLVKHRLNAEEKATARRLLFAGTSAHLESTRSNVRGIGMITGEIIVEMMKESEDAPKLKYDYEGMAKETLGLIKELRNLMESMNGTKNECEDCLKNHFENTGEKKLDELKAECGFMPTPSAELRELKVTEEKVKEEIKVAASSVAVYEVDSLKSTVSNELRNEEIEDLDSDDEPMAYDMSNDTEISKELRPVYLRDLQENLINAQSQTNTEIFAESLNAAEDLILSQLPNDDSSLAIELLEILITLAEASYVKNFESLKFRACVAIVLVYPKEAAKYLCNEFHAKIGAYSIKDRLFILNILGESARRLSKIETKDQSNSSEKNQSISRSGNSKKSNIIRPISLIIDQNEINRHETLYDDDFEILQDTGRDVPNWREMLDARIESRTRRFAGPSKPRAAITINRFNDAAASFFYPLLYGFRQAGTCMYNVPKSFQDQENNLLVNYLKTLSVIMMSAENCVIVPKMAEAILNLAWNLRYHNDATVRLCIIEIIASAIITLPKEALTAQLAELIYELRLWLVDASSNEIGGDPDSQCRSMGRNVVALIDLLVRSTLEETLID